MQVQRSTSQIPPEHYMLKIESFSLIFENVLEKYESGEFEAGGYEWKLVFYPNGNKRENVKDHLSVHLVMANTSPLILGWELYVVFRLFLFDQKEDKFLVIEDASGKGRRFHVLKRQWGFDQFVTLDVFKDPSNGYGVEDTCVFGAEVFVKNKIRRNIGKVECLSMTKNSNRTKHLWKIENFSKLDSKCHDSEVFGGGDYKWKILIYPKGNGNGTGTHLSLFLALDSLPDFKIYADFTIRILNQLEAKHLDYKVAGTTLFSDTIVDWGWNRFISLSKLKDPFNAYLVKDVALVEAEVTVLGVYKSME